MLILKIVILFVLIAAVRGFAVMCGVEWFLTPMGVPSVSFFQALGLSTLLGMLTGSRRPRRNREEDAMGVFWYALVLHIFLLGFMYLWQLGV